MANSYPRYHVVRVSKYLGIYNRDWYAWAVADHAQANHCVSRKYDSQQDAQAEADRLEAVNADTVDPYGRL